jgi:hypothetical protein
MSDSKEVPNDVDGASVHRLVIPRIYGPIAESWVIERGESPKVEWLTPDRQWQGSIFEAARFELEEREKAEWWLQREIDLILKG